MWSAVYPIELAKQRICVFGARGDLGSQLVERITRSGGNVVVCESDDDQRSVQHLLDTSDIIHFCIPSDSFTKMYTIRPHQLLILHDSVMATSRQISRKFFNGKAAIVHMLMNDKDMIVIDSENRHQQRLVHHMKSLGMITKIMGADAHDHIMARSQAPLAVLVRLLQKDLERWHSEHLLTPSGEVLLDTLRDRSSKWTDATLDSLFKNPQISHFIKDMTVLISGK